jgi:hypothetical protein
MMGHYTTRGFYAVRLAEHASPDQSVILLHPYIHPDPDDPVEHFERRTEGIRDLCRGWQ